MKKTIKITTLMIFMLLLLGITACQNDKPKPNDDKNIQEVIAKIDFLIKPSSYKFFRKMELLLPSHKPIIIEDCKTTGIKIDGLHPNSTYRLFLRTYSLNGTVDQSELEFTTPEWINESLRPSANVGEQTDGVTEEVQLDIPKAPPKRVQINGLYGLNF